MVEPALEQADLSASWAWPLTTVCQAASPTPANSGSCVGKRTYHGFTGVQHTACSPGSPRCVCRINKGRREPGHSSLSTRYWTHVLRVILLCFVSFLSVNLFFSLCGGDFNDQKTWWMAETATERLSQHFSLPAPGWAGAARPGCFVDRAGKAGTDHPS